jgi:threonyl-tRNA synthetase
VVGDKEMETGSIAVRTQKGEDLGSMSVEAFCERLTADVNRLGRSNSE